MNSATQSCIQLINSLTALNFDLKQNKTYNSQKDLSLSKYIQKTQQSSTIYEEKPQEQKPILVGSGQAHSKFYYTMIDSINRNIPLKSKKPNQISLPQKINKTADNINATTIETLSHIIKMENDKIDLSQQLIGSDQNLHLRFRQSLQSNPPSFVMKRKRNFDSTQSTKIQFLDDYEPIVQMKQKTSKQSNYKQFTDSQLNPLEAEPDNNVCPCIFSKNRQPATTSQVNKSSNK